jgi:hypothetical protein
MRLLLEMALLAALFLLEGKYVLETFGCAVILFQKQVAE